jgi:hypothetical protein
MFGGWYQKTNKTEDTNKVNLFVSSVLFVFWYHSPNVLDTPHTCNISWLRVNLRRLRKVSCGRKTTIILVTGATIYFRNLDIAFYLEIPAG